MVVEIEELLLGMDIGGAKGILGWTWGMNTILGKQTMGTVGTRYLLQKLNAWMQNCTWVKETMILKWRVMIKNDIAIQVGHKIYVTMYTCGLVYVPNM